MQRLSTVVTLPFLLASMAWTIPLGKEANHGPLKAQDRFFFEYTSPWWGLPKFDIGKTRWHAEDGYFGRKTWGPHKFPGFYSVTVLNPEFYHRNSSNPNPALPSITTPAPSTTTAASKTVKVIVKYKRLVPKYHHKEDDDCLCQKEEADCPCGHYHDIHHEDEHHDESSYTTHSKRRRRPIKFSQSNQEESKTKGRHKKTSTREQISYHVPYFIPAFYVEPYY